MLADTPIQTRMGLGLLFVDLAIPYDCSMRPESEPQPNDVGQEEQDRCEPAVGPHRFDEKLIVNGRNLGKITTSAIRIQLSVIREAAATVAVQFMLHQLVNTLSILMWELPLTLP